MVDIYNDSNTSKSDESADEDSSNLIAEAKRLGANLRTPEKAKIARERKLQTNPAGKSRSTRGQSDPKLSSWQRVQEHKNEYFTSVDGKLRCDACKETTSKKKSTVKKHISSLKHLKAKMTILDSTKKDQSVLELLRRSDQEKHPKEEILPHDKRLYRFDLIQSFLTAGIPFSKIDCLRSFLEKYGHRLTSQSHLRELIPSVLQKEKETLKSELSEAKAVSTIFDGSARLGEALAIIVRFVHNQWNVQQRLVRLQVLVKSLKAEELAQCLIQTLAIEYAIQPGVLLAAMKDGASVNQAALQQVRFFFLQ